ncbi:MAG: signal recognition particle-docking protein FtsY [Fusobacteriaceae bacterium]
MGFFDKLFKRKKTEVDENKELEIKELLEEAKNQHKEAEEELESEEESLLKVELDSEELDARDERDTMESLGEPSEDDEFEEPKKQEAEEKTVIKEKKSFFTSLKDKLFNSRQGLFGKLAQFFTGRTVIDDEMYDELEELLVQSDIGLDMSLKIISALEKEVKKRGIKEPNEVYPVLKSVMENFLVTEGNTIKLQRGKMNVILVVGVNGVGKTTTIGKMASKYVKEGKKVVIGAGDTFRAAAVEQVEEWARRAGAEIVKPVKEGGDPGAVVFDTLKIAEEKGADVAIIDTAGRLHNKNNLMAELEKINNIIKRKIGDQFYESILVIDGTTGQNALAQAKVFNEVTELTGFIVTKLDGTAKGGVLFSISEEIKKPIKFIGVGEKVEDLREFDVKEYIEAIFD